MFQEIKYIGPTQTSDNCIGSPKELVNDEKYNIDIQYQGRNIVINNQQVQDPNGIYWVVFEDDSKFPYTSECLQKQWSIKI